MTALTINNGFSILAGTLVKVFQHGQYADVGFMQGVTQTLPWDFNAPVSTASIQISDQAQGLIIKPAGTIAALTVTMPANPWDGQVVRLTSTQTVTTLTHQASGSQTLNGALTTIGAAVSTHGKWTYRLADTTWYLV